MATVTLNVTNSLAVTIAPASLASGGIVVSNAIDNSGNKFLSALVQLKLKTGASGVSATGYATVYLLRSADGGTTYDDNNKVPIGTIPMIANAATYIETFSTEPFGPLGSTWKISVQNNTGATFDTTAGNFAVNFAGIKYDIG